ITTWMNNLVLHQAASLSLNTVLYGSSDTLPILWCDVFQKSFVSRHEIVGLAEDSEHFIGTRNTVGSEVQLPMTYVCKTLSILQTLFAFSQRSFGPLTFSDVA